MWHWKLKTHWDCERCLSNAKESNKKQENISRNKEKKKRVVNSYAIQVLPFGSECSTISWQMEKRQHKCGSSEG